MYHVEFTPNADPEATDNKRHFLVSEAGRTMVVSSYGASHPI